MDIDTKTVKELRDATGVSIMQCKKALEEAGGDMEKAKVILSKKSSDAAAKKSDRELGAGTVGAYIHATNEVAALVHLASETDFVAKNDEFIALARDIAMQVAAQAPKHISRDDVREEELERVRSVFAEEIADKPENMQEQILEGKLNAYFKDHILLEQPFIKDPDTTIGDLVKNAVQKFGENVAVAEIARVSVR